jgi:hypothetical protein
METFHTSSVRTNENSALSVEKLTPNEISVKSTAIHGNSED